MPENNTDATALAPKKQHNTKRLLPFALIVSFLLITLLLGYIFVQSSSKVQEHKPCLSVVDNSGKVSKCLVDLEVAQTADEQAKGLGDRASMPLKRGMLFVFGGQDAHCFWMKDMKFHLDIIWINSQKQIVHIERDLAPESYPTTFCPNNPAQYAIEVNAGEAQNLGLKEDQQLSF